MILIGFVWWGNKGREDLLTKAIDIPALLPLTGNGSGEGEWIKRGLEIAEEEINKGSKQPIHLVFEDTKGSPKDAVSIYQNLRSRYEFPAVITWGSGVGLALTPLVNSDKIIQMGVATSTPLYSSSNDFTFRNFPTANTEAAYISDVLKNTLHIDDVALVYINNDYGVGISKSFKERFKSNSGIVSFEDSFEPSTTDFHTLVSRIKEKKPVAIYVASYPKEGALLMKQIRELGITVPLIASSAILGDKELLQVAGNGAEGALVSVPTAAFSKGNEDFIQPFVTSYKKHYGELPGGQQVLAVLAYDALHIVAAVAHSCAAEGSECMRSQLAQVHDYKGIGGTITFDINGDIAAPSFGLLKIQNGKFIPYE